MNAAANERFVATFLDWWLNGPVPDVGSDAAGAVDDLKSFVSRLDEAGFEIVEKGEADRVR